MKIRRRSPHPPTSIDRAVWSMWSAPLLSDPSTRWRSPYHYFLGWITSVEISRKQFRTTELLGDNWAIHLLCNVLGLEFDSVRQLPRDLCDIPPRWWAAGKLFTYAQQRQPFLHIDQDAIVWKPLSKEFLRSEIAAQSPEKFSKFDNGSCYRVLEVERRAKSVGGYLPNSWRRYSRERSDLVAPCCGVFGGTNTSAIRRYARAAINVIRSPRNATLWRGWHESDPNVLAEQFMLGAEVYAKDLSVEYVFPETQDPYDEEISASTGFTHLIGDAKLNLDVLARLEADARSLIPDASQRCRAASDVLEAASRAQFVVQGHVN